MGKEPAKNKRKRHARTHNGRLTIGLLIDDLSLGYQIGVGRGVADLAREQTANLICFVGGVLHTPFEFQAQRNVIYELVNAENVDGLVILTGAVGSMIGLEETRKFCERYRPLPMVSVALPLENIPSLLIDNYHSMYDLVEHLIKDHGYRRIAFYRKYEGHPEAEERYRAYTDALTQHGLPLDPDLVVPGDYYDDPTGGVHLLLDQRKIDFEALVAVDDRTALLVLEALRARGIQVPDDVAVVGFDDVEDSRYAIPPLTTMHQPLYEQGKRAAEMVLALLRGEEVPQQVVLPAELVVRRSCGCPSRAVVQAAVEETVMVDEPFAIAFAARRGEILAEVAQVPGSAAAEWVERLLDAFYTDLTEESSAAFLPTLEEILHQVLAKDGDLDLWQETLSVLRRHVRPCLNDTESLSRAEDLWQQGRVIIGEMAQRTQTHQRLEIQRNAETLREVSQTLIGSFTVAELMDMLAQELPRLGIPTCYLSLYEDPQTPTGWSRLVLAHGVDTSRSGERAQPGSEERRFRSPQLIPESLRPDDRRYTLLMESLHFREDQLGFVLFEVGPEKGDISSTLRGQISSALQGATLMQQVERRALRLQTAAEVSHAASSILDPHELIQQIVELARKRFDLYYAGLFLVDQTGEWTGEPSRWAVLRAGTGAAGQQMLEQGHKLEVGGSSMIGWCVANKQARIALDVGAEAVRFDNPLLPETRSELALPLISRGQAIGALTIQSAQEAAFSEEDIAVLQTMADQLANAIVNARLYEALAREQYLMNALMDNVPAHIYFKDTESRFIRLSRSLAKMFSLDDPAQGIGKTDFDFFTEEHARPAYEDEQKITRTGQPILGIEERETWPDRPDTWVLTSKMPLCDEEGHIVGTFGISSDITPRKQAEQALQQREAILGAIALATEKFLRPSDWEQDIQAVLAYLGKAADVNRASIWEASTSDDGKYLINERYEWIAPEAKLAPQVGLQNVPVFRRWRDLLPHGEIIAGHVRDFSAREQEFFVPRGIKSVLAVPIFVNDVWWGFMGFDQGGTEREWTEAEIDALKTAASVLGGALERKRMEESLRESEENFRALADNANDGIMIAMGRGAHVYANRRMAEITGYSVSELLKTTMADLVHPDQLKEVMERFQRRLEGKPTLRQYEIVFVRKDGKSVPLEMTSAKTVWRGQPATIVVFRDITERKRAAEVLERRSTQLQTAAEVSHAASSILDPDELVQQVVNLVRERFDLYYAGLFLVDEAGSEGEPGKWAILRAGTGAAGQQMLEQGHKLEVGGASMIGQCVASGQARIALDVGEEAVRFENPLLPETRSELALPLVSRGQAVGALTIQSAQEAAFSGEDIAVLQTMADQLTNAIVNARLYAALAREQYLLNALMDNVPDFIYFKDTASRFIRTTKAHAKTFGLGDPAEAIGKTDFDFFSDEHARQAYEDEQRIIRTGEPILGIEERETWPDRPDTWVSTSKMPLRDREGHIVGTFGISSDITARKRAELALAEERNLLRTLIDNLPDSVYVKDTKSRFLIANIEATRRVGATTPDELIGKTDFDFYPQNLTVQYRADELEVIRSGQPLIDREELVIDQTTGNRIWNLTTKVPLRDSQGKIVAIVGVGRNITERKQAEEALGRRAVQLQTAAEISYAASSILDPQKLIQQAVDLLRERFDLYYAGLFLMDQTGEWTGEPGRWAVLRAGTGAAGQQMLEQGHKLEVGGSSMIGWCVANKQARIALDVGAEAARFDNPLLPETRSELALPLISRGQAIGALTIQSAQGAAFSEEDIAVLETMAGQVANAIENAHLFERTQAALQEMEATHRRYLRQAWKEYLQTVEKTRYETPRPGVAPLGDAVLPEIQQAMELQSATVLAGDGPDEKSYSALAVPITLRGEIIGILSIHDDDGARQWTEGEIALVNAIAERMALAAENLRLLDETQRHTAEERLIGEVTARVRETLDVDTVLQTAIREIGEALGMAEVEVRLYSGEVPSE